MSKIKPLYDSKILMIDLNFHFIDDGNLDLLLLTQKMIKKLTASQNLILLTDCDIDYCVNKVKNGNLTSGYLVANSGAILYSFATKEIVFSYELEKEMIGQIIKQAIGNNLNFVIHTKENRSYIYHLNPGLVKRYKFDLNKLFTLDSNTLMSGDNVLKIIKNNGISSVEFLFYEKDNYVRKELIKKFIDVAKLIGTFNFCITDATVSIFSHECSKIIAAKNVAETKNIEFENNSIYMGIDQINEDLIKESYFSVIYDKLFEFTNIDCNSDSVDRIVVDGGGISWFDNNEHLWTEPALDILKKTLSNYKHVNLKPSEEIDIKNNKHKFINLNVSKKEISLNNLSVKTYSGYKKEHEEENNIIKKLFFGNGQAEHIINFLKQK